MSIYFRPMLWPTVVSIFVFIMLMSFGTWQIKRLFWKEALIDRYMSQSQSNPIKLPLELKRSDVKEFKSVEVKGSFSHKDEIYINGKTFEGNAGFHVITPFKLTDNSFILINRGWADKKETTKMKFPKKVRIQGLYTPFKRFGLSLSNEAPSYGWPKLVQELSFQQALNDLSPEYNPQPAVIQLSAGSPGAFEPIWRPTIFKAARHYGYAVQWFGLALVLLISYIYFGTQKDSNEHN